MAAMASIVSLIDDKEIERQLLESFARRHQALRRTISTIVQQPLPSSAAGPTPPAAPETLEMRQKYFVSLRESEALQEDLERLKTERERAVEQARADAEEAEARIADLKREAWEFRRDILAASTGGADGALDAASPIASMTLEMSAGGALGSEDAFSSIQPRAEAVREYFERKLSSRASQVDKLRLKNASLQAQLQRLEKEVSARQDEQSEGFSPIDFQQLKIENQQYQERIDARNQELLRLKLQAATTGQALNRYRKHLECQVRENERLKARISQQRQVLAQLGQESTGVSEDRDRAMRINQRLRAQQEEYKVPEVLEYITLKAELHDVTKRVGEWERKVEIAQMAARKQRSVMSAGASPEDGGGVSLPRMRTGSAASSGVTSLSPFSGPLAGLRSAGLDTGGPL